MNNAQFAIQQQIAAIAAMQYQMVAQQQHYMPVHAMGPMGPQTPPYDVDDASESDDEESEEKRTLFCANLDERATEELLYEAFLQAGPIESVRIPKDNGGRQRTFGFVTYVHACSAPYAMQLLQGLSFFRKNLTIKFQGSTQASPMQQRRSLPSDCESYTPSSSRRSYDNNSLRGSNYPSYYDTSMNDSGAANPFKSNSPDWTTGSAGSRQTKERISRHSRPHQNAAPYQRAEMQRRSGESNDHDHDRRGNDYQRRHQSNGKNRRSEQRSGRRR